MSRLRSVRCPVPAPPEAQARDGVRAGDDEQEREDRRRRGHEEGVAHELGEALPALVERFVQSGYIDDEAYAKSIATAKARSGPTSRQLMRSKLESRQIEPDLRRLSLTPVEFRDADGRPLQ